MLSVPPCLAHTPCPSPLCPGCGKGHTESGGEHKAGGGVPHEARSHLDVPAGGWQGDGKCRQGAHWFGPYWPAPGEPFASLLPCRAAQGQAPV